MEVTPAAQSQQNIGLQERQAFTQAQMQPLRGFLTSNHAHSKPRMPQCCTPQETLPSAVHCPSPNILWSMFFLAAEVMALAAPRRAATPDLATAARDQSDWCG